MGNPAGSNKLDTRDLSMPGALRSADVLRKSWLIRYGPNWRASVLCRCSECQNGLRMGSNDPGGQPNG